MHDFRQILDRIVQSMEARGFDWKTDFCEEADFRQLPEEQILKKLFRTMMYRQAPAAKLSKKMTEKDSEMSHLFQGFNLHEVSSLEEKELDGIVIELKALGLGTRFLNKNVKAMPHNAAVFLKIIQDHGSLKSFFEKMESNSDNLRVLLTNKESGYKLREVGGPICSDFLKSIKIPEFKSDKHLKRLFYRLDLTKNEDDIECRKIGLEFAKAVDLTPTRLDYVLWLFCAKDKAEICGAKPDCNNCLLKNKEPQLCKGI